jgi:hypothetical protein
VVHPTTVCNFADSIAATTVEIITEGRTIIETTNKSQIGMKTEIVCFQEFEFVIQPA